VVNVEALFVQHQERVFRYLCRAVGHAETARDLTQDVFVRATGAPTALADDASARAWLFTIARNLALDHHRRSRRRDRPLDPPASASGRATQEVTAAVREALARLGDLDRDVFLMRETAGLSYADIARVCALSPEAVRSRIHRARLELRSLLAAPIRHRLRGELPGSTRNK